MTARVACFARSFAADLLTGLQAGLRSLAGWSWLIAIWAALAIVMWRL
jgi:hypothetical protein